MRGVNSYRVGPLVDHSTNSVTGIKGKLFPARGCSFRGRIRTYLEMIRHETVEEMHIVLAQGAQVEEFLDVGGFQGQLGQTCDRVVSDRGPINAPGPNSTYNESSALHTILRGEASIHRCGDICECTGDWRCHS